MDYDRLKSQVRCEDLQSKLRNKQHSFDIVYLFTLIKEHIKEVMSHFHSFQLHTRHVNCHVPDKYRHLLRELLNCAALISCNCSLQNNRKSLRTMCALYFCFSHRETLMGSMGVWAVAVAALLGTSGCWLAEGHKSSRRSSGDTVSVSRTSSQEPRAMVNIPCILHAHTHQCTNVLYCVPLRPLPSLSVKLEKHLQWWTVNQSYQP